MILAAFSSCCCWSPDGKTPLRWRTEKLQNCTPKMPNVTSETHRKWWFWLLFLLAAAIIIIVVVVVVKMPNVTSETVEKTIVFGGFTATAGCYCHLLLATFAPNAAADNRMPYLLLLLVNRTSNKSTCRQQNTLPLKDELAPESPPKAPADSKTPCHWRTNKSQDSTERCLTLLLKP